MSENCCSTTNENTFQKLGEKVFIHSDINALLEYRNKLLNEVLIDKISDDLTGLEIIGLYFLDLVWMPADLRPDFRDLHAYIAVNMKNLLTARQVKSYKSFEDFHRWLFLNDSDLQTKADEVLCYYICEGLYAYTNGEYGCKCEKPEGISNILADMIVEGYSRLNDDAFILLCLAFYIRDYIDFDSPMERELFESYVSQRKLGLVFRDMEGIEPESQEIADAQNEIYLI